MSTSSNIQSALRVPTSLQLQRVPLQAVLLTALASAVVTIGAVYQDFPLYGIVGLGILPWLPLFFFEAAWKYENYGTYALLGAFVFLQIGHLGEHTVQVLQLWINDGDLSKSHGVFGALDRELVHFAWDSGVWLGVLWILWKFGPHNKWLWISVIAASFHEVEHIFLYYLDRFQPAFYEAGGSTGILAKGGLIGTPFSRPYIHYIYNFFVVVPLIMALWDETKRVYNKWLDKALPDLTEQEKISTTSQLDPFSFDAGEVIVRQGDTADRFYIVSDGRVEVVHEKLDGGEETVVATLGPGQFFGEMGLLTGKPRTATVRAVEDTKVMSLDQTEFTMLVTRSQGGAADLDAALHSRMAEMKKHQVPPAPSTTTPAG
jgi:hypothetical protein